MSKIFYTFILVFLFFSVKGQVNLQTGAAQVSIPLYSYHNEGSRLSTGISLQYTAGNGLKVSEVASSVGTGWDLNMGGFIQRIQKGQPDDQKQNLIPTGVDLHNPIYDYPNGYLYSAYDPVAPMDNGAAYRSASLGGEYYPEPKYAADYEQDFFAFNFNGISGEFVIGKNGTIKTIVDSKLKIEMDTMDMVPQNIRTKIYRFRVTDISGIVYTFSDLELSDVVKYNQYMYYNSSFNIIETLTPFNHFGKKDFLIKANSIGHRIVSKWHLSEIKNLRTGQKINFSYSDYIIDLQGDIIPSVVKSDAGGEDYSVVAQAIKGVGKRLIAIQLSPKERVAFNYYSQSRIDLPFDRHLDNIEILYDNKMITKWVFDVGYFAGNTIYEKDHSFQAREVYYSRLCLKSLKKVTADGEENPYKFNYYVGPGGWTIFDAPYLATHANNCVPPMFSVFQDYGGYYNARFLNYPGSSGYGFTEPVTTSFTPDVKRLTYDYKNFWIANMKDNAGGFSKKPVDLWARNGIVKSVEYPLGGMLTFEYEQNRTLLPGSLTVETDAAGVRVSKTLLYDGLNHDNDIIQEYKYITSDNKSSFWGYENLTYYNDITTRVSRCANNNTHKIELPIMQIVTSILPKVIATSAKAAAGTFFSLSGSSYAASLKKTIIIAVAIKVIEYIVDYILDVINASKEYEQTDYSFSANEMNNLLPAQYSRVEIIDKKGTGNVGRTIYEFVSPSDYPLEISTFVFPYSNRQRVANWVYGNPKSIEVWDNNNRLKRTEYTYNHVKYYYENSNFYSHFWTPNYYRYDCPALSGTSYASEYGWITSDRYYPLCGRTELVSLKEYTYNTNNEYLLKETQYEYSNTTYQLKKEITTNDKGQIIEKRTYYPHDYSLTGVIQNMKDNNMYGVPVATQTFLNKSGTDMYLIGGSVSEFSIIGNNDIKPVKVYDFRSVNPILENQVAFNAAQLLPNNTLYKEAGAISYNLAGNVEKVINNGNKETILYDYDNKLPVAKVSNTDAEEVRYTSFETENAGGWTFSLFDVNSNNSLTGKKGLSTQYNIVSKDEAGWISTTINSGKTYKLSFWLKGDLPVFSGATFTLKNTFENTTNGFTYYEYEITGGSSISLTNRTGSPGSYVYKKYTIDEIKLYPVTARMLTTVYDPLIGKTAEVDENGRIVYYEYDHLGRLKLVLDGNRNVVKAYEYNFKQ